MVFIETPVFTRIIVDLIEDDIYMELQEELLENPRKGTVIPGAGGIRKVRVKSGTKGKRGGVRVIYYVMREDKIYMLYAYSKSSAGDLTSEQIGRLRALLRGM